MSTRGRYGRLPFDEPSAAVCCALISLQGWNDDDTLEIVLEARAARLIDCETPLPAASLRFLAPYCQHILSVQPTDANGVARHSPVAGGSFLVAVEQPGVWLADAIVESSLGGAPRDVQVRRTGTLDLQLESNSNQPVSGLQVELEALEGAAEHSDWLPSGPVTVRVGAAATDANGALRISGLPHGEYLVHLSSPGGSRLAGRVTVNLGPPTSAQLSLP